jgi:hypothetical protein
MSVRNLEYLFRPGSVAVIGASNRPQRVGTVLMRNLLEGGFEGPIMPVNPKYASVAGVLAYPDIASLPMTPDLAVICTPAVTVPGLVARGDRHHRRIGQAPGRRGRVASAAPARDRAHPWHAPDRTELPRPAGARIGAQRQLFSRARAVGPDRFRLAVRGAGDLDPRLGRIQEHRFFPLRLAR